MGTVLCRSEIGSEDRDSSRIGLVEYLKISSCPSLCLFVLILSRTYRMTHARSCQSLLTAWLQNLKTEELNDFFFFFFCPVSTRDQHTKSK